MRPCPKEKEIIKERKEGRQKKKKINNKQEWAPCTLPTVKVTWAFLEAAK